MVSKVAFLREGFCKPLPLPKPSVFGKERGTKKRQVAKTIQSVETVDTDNDEPELIKFLLPTCHVA